LLRLGLHRGREVIVQSSPYVRRQMAVPMRRLICLADSDPVPWCCRVPSVDDLIPRRTKRLISSRCSLLPSLRHGPFCCPGRTSGLWGPWRTAPRRNALPMMAALSGSCGAAAVFSFFGNKIVPTGRGGMVLTQQLPTAPGRSPSARPRAWTLPALLHPVLGYTSA